MGYFDTAPSFNQTTSPAAVAPPLGLWLLPAVTVMIAVVLRVPIIPNTDVTWLLTLAERVLDGHRDFLEINPPGAIFTYIPAVWLSRLIGVSAEVIGTVILFLAAIVSAGSALALLGRTFSDRFRLPLLATGVAAILLILPSYTFAEREHIGTILILPWITLLALRLNGAAPSIWPRICIGIGCGLCMVIKPHFIVVVAALSTFVVWRRQSLRPIFAAENWAIAVVLLVYGLTLWVAFPDFLLHTAPIISTVYVPDRHDLLTLLLLPGSFLWFFISLIGAAGGLRQRDAVSDLLLVGSAAAFLTFLVQGKGWPYHTYPAISLAMLALLMKVTHRAHGAATLGVQFLLAFALVAAFGCGILWFNVENPRDVRALARAVERVSPPRPKIAVITGDMSVGFPLTRMVRGEWVQRSAYLWMAFGSLRLKDRAANRQSVAVLEGYEALDRAALLNDIVQNQPDILLVEAKGSPFVDWMAWARTDARLARALDTYDLADQVDDIQIWRRRHVPM